MFYVGLGSTSNIYLLELTGLWLFCSYDLFILVSFIGVGGMAGYHYLLFLFFVAVLSIRLNIAM